MREGSDPPAPPWHQVGRLEGYFASMKAGLFCVYESRLQYQVFVPTAHHFLSDPTGASAAMLHVTHVARHDAPMPASSKFTYAGSIISQVFDHSISLSPVARHGVGPNVRFK
jgi:hypothetical protein